MSHNDLLLKYSRLGISGSLLKWLESYLNDRVRRVSLNSIISGPLPVSSGVLQGSILGALLFLIYVNDMFTVATTSRLLLFANVFQCFRCACIRHLSGRSVLQSELGQLSAWVNKWEMKFNVSMQVHPHVFRLQFSRHY